MRFSPQLREFDWLVERPIAHRGLHDRTKGIIENTESAFAAALQHNYAIECDLQLTADGEAIVFHDDEVDRLSGATGKVIEFTAKKLRSLALKSTTDRMQTLSEL